MLLFLWNISTLRWLCHIVSICLCLYPTKKTVKLATMECEHENADMIIVWNNFNELVSKYLKIPEYKFNPTGWCVDENGGNWEAIPQVFGEDAVKRTVECEFHYKQC